MTSLEINQDVPQHQEGLTSSIGPTWPPARTSFNRIKGFYTPSIIETPDVAKSFISEVWNQSDLHFLANPNPKVTRTSLRAIFDNDTLTWANPTDLEDTLEAVIPLAGTREELRNCSLVYLGVNHISRNPLKEEIELYKRNLESLAKLEPRTPQEMSSRSIDKGYFLSIARLPDDPVERTRMIDDMTQLYSRFGWNRKDVEDILSKRTNIIGVASYNGSIVSAGIAEMAAVPVGNQTFRMVEITEAATAEEHGKNGLYTSVSSMLLSEVARRSREKQILGGEVDLVFGECNGNALGVLKTAKLQGRTFATETSRGYCSNDRGILYQHVPIAGAPRKTPYNDLFPAFLVREQLYKTFGANNGSQ